MKVDPKSLTVLVTGATSGFGQAICERFIREGARVIASGRRKDRLASLKKRLGARCHAAPLDVRDRTATETFIRKLRGPFDAPNVAVANAGLALGLQPAPQASLDDWDVMVDTNIKGALYTIRAVLPGMVARDEGHIVLMGSVAGDFPYPGGNVYGATKAFVQQLALNLRADLLGSNVRVTDIEPGLARTEFSLVRFKGDAARARGPYEGLEPLTAEDVAETVFWACTLPRHVNVNRLQVMPVMQSFGPFNFKRRAAV
jgi:3-hydroxy acid dehydrogenase / malonic semialdehyde reductase